jgi:hypothetical protein
VGGDRAAREEGRLHVESQPQEEIVALFGWFEKDVEL